MKHYALVNSEGHTLYTISGSEQLGLSHGEVYEGNLCLEIQPDPMDDTYYVNQVYYDHDLGAWQSKPPCPGVEFHSWVDKAWQFMPDLFLAKLRELRDVELAKSDWTQMPDVPLTTEQKEECKIYRQALRDLTSQPTPDSRRMEDVVWPSKPTFL